MVTPSGIQMFLEVGEVVAHRAAADRVGCAMVSDRGEDGVAFKRLGIKGFTCARAASASPNVTSSRCCVQRIPRRRELKLAVLSAERRAAPATAGLDEDPSPLAPLRDLPVPQSNQQRATLTRKGAVDKTQNYGHLATYSARLPNPSAATATGG
jgi:hypothetical protein